jgi:hypothetical protein
MTTLIVHGTLATHSRWYWDSWQEDGFCHAVKAGLEQAGGREDIWRINGVPVSDVEELKAHWSWLTGYAGQVAEIEGHFVWSGDDSGVARDAGAKTFAIYLNKVRELTDEPIHIIAHSHGCNVVKNASSHKKLSRDVHIERAVFLACPHFYAQAYEQKDPFRFKMEPAGESFTYRLDPKRFGSILNVYSERDSVQVGLADKLPGQPGPRLKDWDAHRSSRVDRDERAAHLYTDLEMQVDGTCNGVNAHTVMHGAVTGWIAGQWLGGRSLERIRGVAGGCFPVIDCDDVGE